jgi:hypothetical protein
LQIKISMHLKIKNCHLKIFVAIQIKICVNLMNQLLHQINIFIMVFIFSIFYQNFV